MQSARSLGFTLIELLVAFALIGILTAVVTANVRGADARSRDTQRKFDLRSMQSAIEQYKQKNGQYPLMGTDTDGDGFASETESLDYIVGLTPDFMRLLPHDPKPKATDGYVYAVDPTGSVYKLMAKDSVESEVVTSASEFKRCDSVAVMKPANLTGVASVGLCVGVISNGNSTPPQCQTNTAGYQRSFALSGGWAAKTTSSNVFTANNSTLDLTQQIVCL